MLRTDQLTPALAAELRAAVAWLQANGRPELTPAAALADAVEDWIALLRAEHLRGGEIPPTDSAPSPGTGGRADESGP